MDCPESRAGRHRLGLLLATGAVGVAVAVGPATSASAADRAVATSTTVREAQPLAAKKSAKGIPGSHSRHLTVAERWIDEVLLALSIGAVVSVAAWRPELPWRRNRPR